MKKLLFFAVLAFGLNLVVGACAYADGIEVRRAFEDRGFTGKTPDGRSCFVKFYVPDGMLGPFNNWVSGEIAMTISYVMPAHYDVFHGDPANYNALLQILGHNTSNIISARWDKDSQVKNLANSRLELHIKSYAGLGGATVWRIFMNAEGVSGVHAKRFNSSGDTESDLVCIR
jgi:hypothetical protein